MNTSFKHFLRSQLLLLLDFVVLEIIEDLAIARSIQYFIAFEFFLEFNLFFCVEQSIG